MPSIPTNTNVHLGETDWERIDSSANPSDYTAYLERVGVSEIMNLHRTRFLSLLPLENGNHILDAGCGIGFHARAMARELGGQGRITGIDKSEAMVEAARKATPESGCSNLNFQQGNVCELPCDDESFDGIISDRVFIHLEFPEKALQEFMRVLKPNGWVAITEPDWTAYAIWPESPVSRLLMSSHAKRFQNGSFGASISKYMEAAGFSISHDAKQSSEGLGLESTWNLMNLERGLNKLIAENRVSKEDAAKLKRDLKQAERDGVLRMTANMHYCLGYKKGKA